MFKHEAVIHAGIVTLFGFSYVNDTQFEGLFGRMFMNGQLET
jgi:hypothetical protein